VEKNFFAVEVGFFCLCFGFCCLLCMVLWALLAGVLMALSMLICVTFNVGLGAHRVCWCGSAGQGVKTVEEEGD